MTYDIGWADFHNEKKKRTPLGIRFGIWFMSALALVVWLWIFLCIGAAIIDHYDGRVGTLSQDYYEGK